MSISFPQQSYRQSNKWSLGKGKGVVVNEDASDSVGPEHDTKWDGIRGGEHRGFSWDRVHFFY